MIFIFCFFQLFFSVFFNQLNVYDKFILGIKLTIRLNSFFFFFTFLLFMIDQINIGRKFESLHRINRLYRIYCSKQPTSKIPPKMLVIFLLLLLVLLIIRFFYWKWVCFEKYDQKSSKAFQFLQF